MKTRLFALSLSLLLALGLGACSPNNKAEQAKQLQNYPLKTCPVSGAKLGEMGPAVNYWHQYQTANGQQQTELVRFCCSGCIKTFKENPQAYLSQLKH